MTLMPTAPIDLEGWLAAEPRALALTLLKIARACAEIAEAAARAPLVEARGLDRLADHCLAGLLADCVHVAGWASTANGTHCVSERHAEQGRYLVCYAPLGGATDLESNLSVGTVFSVLPHPFHGTTPGEAGFLQPGRRQLAAGYAMYGPSTLLALSCGKGVAIFVLDREAGRWRLSRDEVSIAPSTSEFAINASNQRHWEKPVQRYVAECLAGEDGPRGRDFNMYWLGSPVAATHRLLTRGGVFLHPRDTRTPRTPGRLPLLGEAAPLAFLVEQAGGSAVTGSQALLEVVPDMLAQKVPAILGARDEVQLIVSHHADPSENVGLRLFRTRSLFVQPHG